MNFYERFKELCDKVGKSPTGVGLELGLHRSTITYWKEGHTPKHEILVKIADYFSVPVDYLVGLSNNKNVINGDDIAKVALFGGDSDVTEEMWEEVKEFVKYVKSKHGKD